ncbi:hypothetical protein Cabther_A2256 [Chloracidobacterium thermophilum B]|uniref:Uncharacterized protein n=1 Tax=Chloracidobacterium thermophilum (strain B) TaxID=981222 RepID=G2LF63_CHLTF|nr:hypothetical protein Cabther_A2256 [Chloracidobacterium thermophilum B]
MKGETARQRSAFDEKALLMPITLRGRSEMNRPTLRTSNRHRAGGQT